MRARSKSMAAAAGAALLVGAVCVGTMAWAVLRWETEQPVPFDHKRHVDMGLTCASCHAGSKEDESASIPGASTCALCHVPGKAGVRTPPRLRAVIESGGEIVWKRVYEAPDHVRFSHQRHAGAGGLDCRGCHGDVGALAGPVARRLVPLTMGRCMSCHRKEGVSTDCLACHR